MKEDPQFILKPNIINAFFPSFLKYFFKIIIYVGIPILIILLILSVLNLQNYNLGLIIGMILLVSLVISIAIIFLKIFIFYPRIEYRFYKNHLEVESKLFKIEKKSVPYNKITNIDTKISLWDRITNAGDIIIHTADENKTGDIHLLFIKNPIDIEKHIQTLIVKTHKTT